MLLRFSVSNYLSFHKEVILNMLPAKSKTKKDHILVDREGKKSVKTLPLAMIYGANASGKTNLVNALEQMRDIVISDVRPEEDTGIVPFKLNPISSKSPSQFEIEFKHNGVLYTYGFVATRDEILEEWLFAYYTIQESRIFERITRNGRTLVETGQKFDKDAGGRKFLEFIAKGTLPNKLFLTEAFNKNIEMIQPVFKWFRSNLHIIRPRSQYAPLTFRLASERNFLKYLSEFLITAGTGIEGLNCSNETFNAEKHLSDVPNVVKNKILKFLSSSESDNIRLSLGAQSRNISIRVENGKRTIRLHRVTAKHKTSDGSSVFFDLESESDGTKRLMDLVPALEETRKSNDVFIIDELDRSLHTHLSMLFIKTFLESVKQGKTKGQFVFTTHDTNLLEREFLRKDEIWFMEKSRSGESHLTSLAEYKVNEGLNYQKGYLNGRFGAIPFIGDVDKLFENGD